VVLSGIREFKDLLGVPTLNARAASGIIKRKEVGSGWRIKDKDAD